MTYGAISRAERYRCAGSPATGAPQTLLSGSVRCTWLGSLIADGVASRAARAAGPPQWLVARRAACLDAARRVCTRCSRSSSDPPSPLPARGVPWCTSRACAAARGRRTTRKASLGRLSLPTRSEVARSFSHRGQNKLSCRAAILPASPLDGRGRGATCPQAARFRGGGGSIRQFVVRCGSLTVAARRQRSIRLCVRGSALGFKDRTIRSIFPGIWPSLAWYHT